MNAAAEHLREQRIARAIPPRLRQAYGMCGFLTAMLTLTLGIPLMVRAQDPWNAFDKEPLTIIYPEKESPSDPPFLYWQAVDGAARYSLRITGAKGESTFSTTCNFFTPSEPLGPGYYSVEINAWDKQERALLPPRATQFEIPQGRPGLSVNMNGIASRSDTRLAYGAEEVESIRAAGEPRATLVAWGW